MCPRGAGLTAVAAVSGPALAHAGFSVARLSPTAAAAQLVAGRAISVLCTGLTMVATEVGGALAIARSLCTY